MKKNLLYIAFAAALLAGCTEKWDEPEPLHLATDAEIEADSYTLMSINDFKQTYFYDSYTDVSKPSSDVKAFTIADDQKVYLKGKVISSDEQGNIYRSLYIQDATGWQGGALELKLGTSSLYNTYKPGQIVYVKTDGLVLGNYRWMLSLGAASVESKYSNGYIDIQGKIDQKILRGEIVGLTKADTLVIDATNASQICNNASDRPYLGCLTRFENVESIFGTISNDTFSDSDVFPSYLWSYTFPGDEKASTVTYLYDAPHYNQKLNDDGSYAAYPNTWAYSYVCQSDYSLTLSSYAPHPSAEVHFLEWDGLSLGGTLGSTESYYGSALFVSSAGDPFVVRTSGYSRFALNEVPAGGVKVDMTAILSKYCSSGGGYTKYQLILNSDKDVKIR